MPGAEELPHLMSGGWEYIPPRQGFGAPLPAGSASGDAALTGLASMFQALQTQAQRLQAAGDVKVMSAPYAAHCKAVGTYLEAAKAVFNDLRDKGFVVVQKLLDVNRQPLGESRGAPVSPTTLAGCGGVVQPAVLVEVMLIEGGSIIAPQRVTVRWPSELVDRTEKGISWLDNYLACVVQARRTAPAQAATAVDAACQLPSVLRPGGGGLLAQRAWRHLAIIAVGSLSGILLVWLLTRSRRPPEPSTTMEGCPCL
jgi:hypothetical protein